jgi:hypothetical protein
MDRAGISSFSSGENAESSDADVDVTGEAIGTDVSASSGAGAAIGIKPVQQMSLWNSWPTSDPPQYDAEVRVGL